MSVHRRARPRSRRRVLHLEYDTDDFWMWLPQADDPLVLTGFGDAASLALELTDWPVTNEALVLLDARRHVTAMLIDPPPTVGLFVGRLDLPALEVPFCQTLSVVVGEPPIDGPPPERHRQGYFALRRFHMLQGLLLMDVILADPERVQSLAIACDPDAIWFDDLPTIERDGPADDLDRPAA